MELSAWLRSLGLERYEPAFRGNDIATSPELARLTGDDLLALGVASVGHRRRLLDAIAALPPAGGAEARPARTAEAPRRAERRQLTIMFVDLVDSTALSVRLDPEEMRDLITAYQQTVAREVDRLGGTVAKYMGDGVLCYFGWPTAHEDDAERSVQAGLAVVGAVAGLGAPASGPLAARVGIATGVVVVGDLVGEGSAQEQAVVGETPNLAARIQSLAEPGVVLVSAGTRRLLGHLFKFSDWGEHRLRGFPEPVLVFRAEGPAGPAPRRFAALRGHGLTPLVGREEELAHLLGCWRRAREGEGQAVLLEGEPGIGKSRLMLALQERLEHEAHACLTYFCSRLHQASPFHPFIEELERSAKLARGDSPEQRLEKLTRLSGRGPGAEQAVAAMADLFAMRPAPVTASSGGALQERRARLGRLWLDRLAGLSARGPVLMLVEDAHWCDPSSLEQIDRTIDAIGGLPVLLVASFRSGFMRDWSGGSHVTRLALRGLDKGACSAMVDRLVGSSPLPPDLREQAIGKAEGIPLFLEELTRSVLETEPSSQASHALSVPATLHDLLMARLDRLAGAKEVAQVASVIGREFPLDLLAEVADCTRDRLDEALAALAAADLAFPRRQDTPEVYEFKHALVQEAAYGSLLRGDRRPIHGRLATALERRHPAVPPEIIAHHMTEAGRRDAAIDWWTRAGHHAQTRAASREAVTHFERALALLAEQPDSVDRGRQDVALRSALAGALINVAGLGSDALESIYVKARDLCEQVGDERQQFIAEWGLWHIHVGRSQLDRARLLSERLMEWAERAGDTEMLLEACHAQWATHNLSGEEAVARRYCERGWGLYDELRHGHLAFVYGGHDPGVCSRINGARAAWCLGYPDRALAETAQGLELARRLAHPQIVAHALTMAMQVYQLGGDAGRLEGVVDDCFRISAEKGFANYRSDAVIMRGWLLDRRGEPGEAIRTIREGLAERDRIGTVFVKPYFLSLLAGVQARAGASAEGLATVEEGLALVLSGGEAWARPELLRLKGELLSGGGPQDRAEAERCLEEALAVARDRGTRGWELRAAVSLARLLARQGRPAEARLQVEAACRSFTEGFDAPDLRQARAVLEALG